MQACVIFFFKVLGSGYKGTCETDATCKCPYFSSMNRTLNMHQFVSGNLYVVLVLYWDGEEKICDYLRFWSKASSSAEFHHAALRAVKQHLTGDDQDPRGGGGRIKNLRRFYVWTDGHSSTYKGFQNFGRMAQWPQDPARKASDTAVRPHPHNPLPFPFRES